MDTPEKTMSLTADEFLDRDQRGFGDAWRYELVDGRVLAHAAPTPTHGAIVAGLLAALGARLREHSQKCRPEAGSGAAPASRQRSTARIPDAMVRCGELPRIAFEVVSASELKAWRERDRKRVDLQDVEGVREIVEVYQDEIAVHVYRKAADGSWAFEALGGSDAVLKLVSVDLEIPLAEIYEFSPLGGP
jgi:Uma2 family endonuclease